MKMAFYYEFINFSVNISQNFSTGARTT